MIDRFKEGQFVGLLDFLKNNKNSDFYITENNIRCFVNDEKSLRKFLKSSKVVYVKEEAGDIKGIILIWTSLGNDIKRYFVKLNAVSDKIARNLITVLLWNYYDDLYIKIHKDSSYVKILKEKGFNFKGDRGKEILLQKYRTNKPIIKNDKHQE